MFKIIDRFKDAISGVIHGFDRIVFQGFLMPLMYPEGAMSFFDRRQILYKDSAAWVQAQTAGMISAIDAYAKSQCGAGIKYIGSSRIRKEALAHERQQEHGIQSGLIGAWSCVEAGTSYKIMPSKGHPILRYAQTRCKHIYLYLDHPDYGFMNIRIQTWLPYKMQIALNGREWLARQLGKAGVSYDRQRNKFTHIDDYQIAQGLLDSQLNTDWRELLDGFLPLAFPTMQEVLGPELSYTWTCWQSEWASDLIFRDTAMLDDLMESCVKHAFISGHAGRLYRFFGRPVNKRDQPHHAFRGNIQTRLKDASEGFRIRHWINQNSVKLYNEHNVVRIETTLNDPSAFRVHRRKQGAPKDSPKERLPLRKGVADLRLRAKVSQDVNDRFSENLAAMESATPMKTVLDQVVRKKTCNGRRVRALDPFGKDRDFLATISDPVFAVSGFTNKDLRQLLASNRRFVGKTEKQVSGAITRLIRLMRDHGMIRKYPRQHRYQLTTRGREITTLVHAALSASTKALADIAA